MGKKESDGEYIPVKVSDQGKLIISGIDAPLNYKGTWDASTNTPTLASGVGTKGDFYIVSVAGSTNIDGETNWMVGDWILFNGTAWERIDNSTVVSSVDGKTGDVDSRGTNRIYVRANGDDADDGLSDTTAVQTIGQAITLASALTPAQDNRIRIEVMDSADYAENITIPQYCDLYAPTIRFLGTITVNDNCSIRIGEGVISSGTFISKTSGTGKAYIYVEKLTLTGSANGYLCTSGELHLSGHCVSVENGYGVGSTSTALIVSCIQHIHITGTGYGIGLGGAGEIDAVGATIRDSGSGTGVYALTSGSSIRVNFARVDCSVSVNCQTDTTVYAQIAKANGNITNNGSLFGMIDRKLYGIQNIEMEV